MERRQITRVDAVALFQLQEHCHTERHDDAKVVLGWHERIAVERWMFDGTVCFADEGSISVS